MSEAGRGEAMNKNNLPGELLNGLPAMKPCPFCQAKPDDQFEPVLWQEKFLEGVPSCHVLCTRCGAQGPSTLTPLEAVEKYNRRYYEEKLNS